MAPSTFRAPQGSGSPLKRHSICRVRATETGAVFSAISRASSRARSIRASGSTTSATRPPAFASSAWIRAPERHQRRAVGRPTSRGRNQALPASGTRPRRAKTKPIRAPLAAMRMSMGRVRVAPTPTAAPFRAAMMGLRQLKRAPTKPPPERRRAVVPESPKATEPSALESNAPAPEEMSAPAQKARPAPVTMITRTLSSSSARTKASSISRPMVAV